MITFHSLRTNFFFLLVILPRVIQTWSNCHWQRIKKDKIITIRSITEPTSNTYYILLRVRQGRKKREEQKDSRYKVNVSSVRERLIRRDRDSPRCERFLHSNQYSTYSYTYSRNPRTYICSNTCVQYCVYCMLRVEMLTMRVSGIFTFHFFTCHLCFSFQHFTSNKFATNRCDVK